MEINQNIAEYYDELYPVTEEQKRFYEERVKKYSAPVKFLRIGCGTGTFEHNLAREGFDVTGLETSTELLESANRKRRTQLMAVRYFQMSSLEMSRFLGRNFYDIISILDNRILFIRDEVFLAKFFYDCHELLRQNGCMILTAPNFDIYPDKTKIILPERKSIRAMLTTTISLKNDQMLMDQKLETGNGRRLTITEDAPVNLITKEQIQKGAKEAGFTSVEFFADFELNPLTESSENILAVIS
ncbi:MAG: methyltransferase domain-containing protein, partial [Treponema sp.]|nr:methyltransferase domain-containing protein [Treponema sp.]